MNNHGTAAKLRDKLLLRLLKTPPQPRPKRERNTEASHPKPASTEVRAVGRNDFGAREDEVMEIITPFLVPVGTIFRNCRTGELIDSEGNSVASSGSHKAAVQNSGLPQTVEVYECLGMSQQSSASQIRPPRGRSKRK
jgi:hypothetical protein